MTLLSNFMQLYELKEWECDTESQ